MQLTELIPDLLYRHNCVILPAFGGFVANFKPSDFKEDRLIASPAIKKVAFNQSLVENDGLLIQNLAQRKQIPYAEAEKEVNVFIRFLQDRLKTYRNYEFKNIGTLYLNKDEKMVFVPYEGLNFFPKSYGLEDVKVKKLQRLIDKERIREYRLDKDAPIIEAPEIRPMFPWKTVAASLIVLAGFSFMIWQLMGQGANPMAVDTPPGNSVETASLLPDSDNTDNPDAYIKIEDVTEEVLPSREVDENNSTAEDIIEYTDEIPKEIAAEYTDEPFVDNSNSDESSIIEEANTIDTYSDESADDSYLEPTSVDSYIPNATKTLVELQQLRSEHFGARSIFYIVVARGSDQQVLDKITQRFSSRSFNAFQIEGTKKGEKVVCVEQFHNQTNAQQFLKLIRQHETPNAEILELTK